MERITSSVIDGSNFNIDGKVVDDVIINNNLLIQQIFANQKSIMTKLNNIEKNNTEAMNLFKNLKENVDVLKKDVDGIIESQKFINNEHELEKKELKTLKKQVQKLLNDNTAMTKHNDDLKKSLMICLLKWKLEREP